MSKFDYYKPSTLLEALSLYDKYGEKAKLLLGGTDLAVLINDGIIDPEVVIDLKGIDEIKKLEFSSDSVYIGANVTFNDLIASEQFKELLPVVWESSRTIASFGVRNRATLVGNICSAVPSADSAPALLVSNAVVVIKSLSQEKKVPVDKFFIGPRKTVLQKGEIVVGIKFPVEKEQFGSSYLKLGRYKGEDLAQVGIATFVNNNKVYRIAFGAVAPVPLRAYEAEDFLKGKGLDDSLIADVIPIALKAISPITDVRASKEYRLHVSGVLLKRSLLASKGRLEGKGPEYGKVIV
jgi:CO/xanthine dehydrogenase FAD-binding subunit